MIWTIELRAQICLTFVYFFHVRTWHTHSSHGRVTGHLKVNSYTYKSATNPWLSIPHTAWWHDAVIKWKHFPRYWPFVWGIHRSQVNSPHKGQWCGALMFSLICTCINGWVNNRKAGDLRRHRAHYDVIVMDNIPWKPFPHYWIFVRGIYRSPVDFLKANDAEAFPCCDVGMYITMTS